jgi:diguanylate cyclase (GGDEF)-like protein/PAS domain S-box-containing protein
MEAQEDAGPDPPRVSILGMSPQDQADLFAGVAMSVADAVVVSDRDGTILWVNPATTVMFGWSVEELVGRAFTVLFTGEGPDGVRAARDRVLGGEQIAPIHATGRRRDGETFEVAVTSGVRRDGAGRPVGVSLVLHDVTGEPVRRRELTEALARSRARFDQSALPQALLDVEGRFVEVNDAACALLGWSREELVGRSSGELVHAADPDLVRARLARLRDGTARSASCETTGLTRSGREVPLQVDITAVRDPDGRARELAAVARDLRELREVERRLASQEAFFRALNRESSDVTLVGDTTGRLLYVTPSVTQVLGYQPDEILDVLTSSRARSEDLAGQDERRRRLRDVPGTRERSTLRLQDSEGEWRWFEATATNCVEDPDIGGIVVHLREVTPEVEAEQALRDSEARYRAIAETAQEGILAVAPMGDILFANERLADILGIPMDQVYALGGQGIFAPDEAADAALRLAARSPEEGPERFDFRYQHPQLGRRVLHVSASSLPAADGSVLGSLAMVVDVTEQRAAEEALRRQALHDALTGLPNRLMFLDRLTRAAARQERAEGGVVAVLFLDLDNFKAVNDLHGHEVGDRLLVEVARRLEQAVRATDTVARLGGDEFAVICEGADAATASLVASRVQEAFKDPVAVTGEQFPVGMSIGVALSPPYSADSLLRYADSAMYHAKATARGGVVTYGDELADEATRRLGLTRAVREALDAGALSVVHQPLVELAAHEVVAWQPRVLWNHPTLGRIESEEVSRAADRLGRSIDLDRLLLRAAVAGLEDLRRRGAVGVATPLHVGLAAGAGRARALVATVEDVLVRTGLNPACLVVGVDVRALVQDAAGAQHLSARLAELGVGVLVRGLGREPRLPTAEDLSQLTLTGLGVDREVVRALVEDGGALASVRAVVALAQELGVRVYAEGVDTSEQVAVLQEVGCDVAGGAWWPGPDEPGGGDRPDGSAS